MKGNARAIIAEAQTQLQDIEGVRWSAGELVGYLNEGQRMIVSARPSESARSEAFQVVDGPRQPLPEYATLLLDAHHNSSPRQRALTKVERHTLETVARDWMSMQPSEATIHYMYSDLEPRAFYVYPPAIAGSHLQVTFSVYPEDVATPTGPTAASVNGDTGLEARWDTALLDYVLFRAWSKDAEYAANEQRASSHLGLFTTSVSVQATPAKT